MEGGGVVPARQRAQVLDRVDADGGDWRGVAERPDAAGGAGQLQAHRRTCPMPAEVADDLGDDLVVVPVDDELPARGPGGVEAVHPRVPDGDHVAQVDEGLAGQQRVGLREPEPAPERRAGRLDRLGADVGQLGGDLRAGTVAPVVDLALVRRVELGHRRVAALRAPHPVPQEHPHVQGLVGGADEVGEHLPDVPARAVSRAGPVLLGEGGDQLQ